MTSRDNSHSKLDSELFDQGKINTRTDHSLDRLVRPVGWLVPFVAVISVYEVVARYVLDSPTIWVHETSTLLIAVVFLIGGVRAMARNQHVKIDLLRYLLPVNWLRGLNLVRSFLLIPICAALVYVAALTAWDATHARPGLLFYFERSGSFWNPPFPAFTKLALLVACVFLFVQSIAQFRHALNLKTSDAPDTEGQ
ncbi:TRAP transporter small permease subunit [Pelagibius sp. Alg239-R121]|uniref:TRAP transporter small permease subunit n=1 Tax=Pelagibius sp. Alg239-R121 TaxID=2993448 RepID=UPI0024A796F0|nr:TRAP transporter small permease [Pelagibius sp. Alg239-R121]